MMPACQWVLCPKFDQGPSSGTPFRRLIMMLGGFVGAGRNPLIELLSENLSG